VVALGLNWKGATVPGAVTAIVSALIINFGVQLTGIALPYGVSGGLLSFVVSLFLFVNVSLLTKPPSLDNDIDRAMDI
jgi:Na+/proline symporter